MLFQFDESQKALKAGSGKLFNLRATLELVSIARLEKLGQVLKYRNKRP